MELQFFKQTPYKILIVTGACRTGKTTLSRYLAESESFEFLDEPWLPMFWPLLVEQGQISETLGRSLINAYFDELCNDVLLYRRANFRPGDQSGIWNFKSATDILSRLVNVNSRDDVQRWVKEKNTTFVFALPETTPFIRFFLESLSNVRILYLKRDRDAVAQLIAEKAWYGNEQLQAPVNNQPYRRFSHNKVSYYMPWWLQESSFEDFIQWDDHRRGEYYWDYFNASGEQQVAQLSASQKKQVLNLQFSEMKYESDELRARIADFCQ